MMTAERPADTRMMGIAHAAFRRDLTRVRQVLTATPVPQGGRRQAVADQVLWLMQALHAHHTAEDAGLWPLVRQRNPAAAQLLDAMEADHRAIVPAMQTLTAAARQYRSRLGQRRGCGSRADGGAAGGRAGASGPGAGDRGAAEPV